MPIRRPDHGCHGYSSSRNSVLWAFSSLVVQHDQAARIARIQAASTGGIRPCLRRVTGCATPTGSVGHAGATASLKLTFHLDHSVGANQSSSWPSVGIECHHFGLAVRTVVFPGKALNRPHQLDRFFKFLGTKRAAGDGKPSRALWPRACSLKELLKNSDVLERTWRHVQERLERHAASCAARIISLRTAL
jgi:hypothetical protein